MPPAPFDATSRPTSEQLAKAAALPVQDKDGHPVPFGSLVSPVGSRTIVLFIRHFGCGLCQDMVSFVASKLPPAALAAHGVRLVIVGNGSAGLIGPYRDLLECPFEVYTDPSKGVYAALGM